MHKASLTTIFLGLEDAFLSTDLARALSRPGKPAWDIRWEILGPSYLEVIQKGSGGSQQVHFLDSLLLDTRPRAEGPFARVYAPS